MVHNLANIFKSYPDIFQIIFIALDRRVSALARAPGSCEKCELYRVEEVFRLSKGPPPGHSAGKSATGCSPAPACQPGPRVMVRGDVGWAGGGAGPDFFIYLDAQPAD